MNIQYMKYAVEVEHCGSISRAAQNLFMGQPNLSKAIKELESQLGIKLFRRTSKGVSPTVQGKEFLSYAKHILQQIEEIELMYRPQTSRNSFFRVSIPRSSYITDAFTSFVAALDGQDGIELTIRETNSLRTIRNVSEDNYDLGIIRFQSSNEQYFMDYLKKRDLKCEDILEFEYYVLMSSSNPLAMEEELSVDMLAPYIEILHGDYSVPFVPQSEGGTQAKKRIYVFERGSQFDLLSRISKTYMWVSPMPKDLLRRHHMTTRKCRGSIRHKDVLIYRDGHHFGDADRLFMDKLKECVKRIKATGK